MIYLRIIHAAIRRYHIEKPIRDQFRVNRTQAKLPFGAMLRRLVKAGNMTKGEQKTPN